MPKISVIVPVYNVEKYLKGCIDSILSQSFNDFELILINDGSTDNSEKICLEYSKKDKRIIYISQKNQGVSAARNKGLKNARGTYIFIMDSDDTIDIDFLNFAYMNAVKNDTDIVVCGEYYLLRKPIPPALPVCACFFKHALLKNDDIQFPVGIQPCEDGLFSHQLIAFASKISFEPCCIYYYRQHENQNHALINANCEKVLKQIPSWLEILETFYTRNDLWSSKAQHLIKFVEHELFGLRLQSMPFDVKQRNELYHIIKDFLNKYKLVSLAESMTDISIDFKIFIQSNSLEEFDLNLCNQTNNKRKETKMLSKYFHTVTKSSVFQKQLNSLISELKDKRILIYGAGEAFINLNKKYRFDKLNVVAISDIKFCERSKFEGLLSIPPDDIDKYEYDIVLVTVESSKNVVNYLVNKQSIDENKIRVIFYEDIPMENENYSYLESLHFNRYLKYLANKLQNKTVVLYGAGDYLKVIKKYYDLSGLNIIGVADKRFIVGNNDCETFLGYKTMMPDDLKKANPDYVLVSTKYYIGIIDDLMFNVLADTKIKIRPLVKKPFLTLMKEIWGY